MFKLFYYISAMNWHLFVNIQLAEHSCAHSILYYEMYHSSAGKCRFRLRAEHRKLCDRYKLRSKTRRLCVWDGGERGGGRGQKKREIKPLGHIKIFLPVEPFPMKREHSLFQTRSLEGTGSDRNVNWFQRNIVRRKSSVSRNAGAAIAPRRYPSTATSDNVAAVAR